MVTSTGAFGTEWNRWGQFHVKRGDIVLYVGLHSKNCRR